MAIDQHRIPRVDVRSGFPWSTAAIGRSLGSVVVVVVGVMVVRAVATSEAMEWSTVGQYFFDPEVMRGLRHTLELTLIAVTVGVVLGLGLATSLMSRSKLLRAVAEFYKWFFRGTPLLVQLILWYNLASLFPTLTIAIPFGPTLFSAPTNSLVSPWTAAILGLGLHEAAYMAEIIRGGLISVHKGQRESAIALGLTKRQVLRLISIPQAMRVIIPPMGNQVINVVKLTSLVSVIAIPDLLYSVEAIYSTNYKTIPLLLVATIWYLIVVSILTVLQAGLERRFSRDLRPAI